MARGHNYVANARRRVALEQARVRGRGRTSGASGKRSNGLRGPAPMPWDSQAQRESGELGNESADTRAQLTARLAAAQSALGFGPGESNPYSASGENKRSLEANTRATTNTAGNNLYSGSTANQQSINRSAYDRAQKGIEGEEAEAQSEYDSGVSRAAREQAMGEAAIKEGAINRAAETEPTPLAVGRSRKAGGRGRLPSGPGADGRNVRRPSTARQLNARARAINRQVTVRNQRQRQAPARARGRGRI